MKATRTAGYAIYVVVCVGWLLFALQHGAPLAASEPKPVSARAAADASQVAMEIPSQDIWHMYNALEQDENQLNRTLVAIPVVVTLLLVLTPFVLNLYVASKVDGAVAERIKEAAGALERAESTYASSARELDLKISEMKALVDLRLAYLHWHTGDPDFAVFYAQRSARTAIETLAGAGGSSAVKLREFLQDAQDSLAYYIADSESAQADANLVSMARERAMEMLRRLTSGGNGAPPDLEAVDTCLFVSWSLRGRFPVSDLVTAAELYANWAEPLATHRWKNRQQRNYLGYKDFFERYADRAALR